LTELESGSGEGVNGSLYAVSVRVLEKAVRSFVNPESGLVKAHMDE